MKKTNNEWTETFGNFIQQINGNNKPFIDLESQKGEYVEIQWALDSDKMAKFIKLPKVDIAKWLDLTVVDWYDDLCIVDIMPMFNPVNGYDETEMHTQLSDYEFDWEEIEQFCIEKGVYDKGEYEC